MEEALAVMVSLAGRGQETQGGAGRGRCEGEGEVGGKSQGASKEAVSHGSEEALKSMPPIPEAWRAASLTWSGQDTQANHESRDLSFSLDVKSEVGNPRCHQKMSSTRWKQGLGALCLRPPPQSRDGCAAQEGTRRGIRGQLPELHHDRGGHGPRNQRQPAESGALT